MTMYRVAELRDENLDREMAMTEGAPVERRFPGGMESSCEHVVDADGAVGQRDENALIAVMRADVAEKFGLAVELR